jgi:hypothetical protein
MNLASARAEQIVEFVISAMGAQTEVQTAGGQFYNPLNPRSGSNRYSRQARGRTIFPFCPAPFFPPDLFLYLNFRRLFNPTSTFFSFIVYLSWT